MGRIKTLFVYVNPLRMPYVDLGIASLSAYLRSKGYETRLIDLTFDPNIKRAVRALKEYGPDIVCFTSRSGEFRDVARVAGVFRDNHKALYLCGGIHPTIAPEEVIAYGCFDGIGVGEGDVALHELVTKLENGEGYLATKGFWFKQRGKIARNPARKLVHPDCLPLMDYDLFDMEKYLNVRRGHLDYGTARGCPFPCTYCVNHTLRKLYRGLGSYPRRKSPAIVISELKTLKRKYPLVRSVKIADEHFLIDKGWLEELAGRYHEEIDLPFECDARADFCDEDTMRLLKEMGCAKLNIAIESGDEALRRALLNKNISDEDIINAFRLAKKYGLYTMSLNMVGLPLETKEQINKTIEMNRVVEPDSIQVSIFTPYKGTALHRFCREKNLLLSDEVERTYFFGNYLSNPHISPSELKNIHRQFAYQCYRNRSLVKACILLLREFFLAYYLRYAEHIPPVVRKGIFSIFWNVKSLRFVSK